MLVILKYHGSKMKLCGIVSAYGVMSHWINLMVDPLSYFLFQPVLYDWCNIGCGMYNYPVRGMVHIKESLLLIRNSLCSGSSGLAICSMPHRHK